MWDTDVVSRRQLRGFDPARLRIALDLLPLRVLRAALSGTGESSRGSKDDVVGRLHAHVERGDLPFRVVCEAAKKADLRDLCSQLDLDVRGRKTELSARLERAVRFSPLGNIASLPAGFEDSLDPELSERERLLAMELHARLRARDQPVTRVALTELIGRLGHHRAEFRVRRAAARNVGEFLHAQGIVSEPDLRTVTSSPGREAFIVLSFASHVGEDSAPARTLNAAPAELEGTTAEAEATLALGVANADDYRHPRELEVIRERLDTASLPDAGRLLEKLRTDTESIELAAHRLAASTPVERRRDLFRHLVEVAWADGVLVESEATLLRSLGQALELQEGTVEAALRSPTNGSSEPEPEPRRREPVLVGVREEGPEYASAADPYVDEILELLFA